MKFTDGNWLMRPGYELIRPIEVYAVSPKDDSVIILASPRNLHHRGAQLDMPLLTVHYSAPMENVIRVQVYRHKGGRPRYPEFDIYENEASPVVIEDDLEQVRLQSGTLRASINKKQWSVDFYDGHKRLTGTSSVAHVTGPKGETYMREQLDLSVGENVYGLGERFTPFVKNGQVVDSWNEDGGTSTEQSYKNIPFYLSNRGYGVFVNHPELVSYELASERVSKAQFSVEGEYLEYFIIGGGTPKRVLENYTTLTGKPALPPAWSFGLWLTTSFTTDYDEETVNHFVEGMKERDIPLHVFHFDCFWMKAFHWTDFEWDASVFPEPEAMLKRLKEKGLKICVWINPYIAQQSRLFDEGMEKGYLLKKANGDVWQWDRWQPGMGIVDFTNPQACEWYAGYLEQLIDMGVDSFKTDFGERIPTNVAWHDGADPQKMHNYYTHMYNKVVFDVLEKKNGKGQAVLFARSATAGGQQYPVHWGGDCFASYPSMAESLRGGLSLCLSGFGYWSHDIGGFESTAPADVYKRWTAFGLLSSHSRLHGNHSYRVPWLFDDEAVDVMRHFTKLKCRLMPYMYAAACEASEKGIPMMRAMLLEFNEDPTCDGLDRQYMLGDSLLVAPIFSEDGDVTFYVPHAEGTWTHFLSGKKIDGGRWHRETHDYMSLPLYVRPNRIIPVGRDDQRPDYDFAHGVELHVFEPVDGKSTTIMIPNVHGEADVAAQMERVGNTLTVRVSRGEKPWSIVLRGRSSVTDVEGASTESSEQGVRVTPEPSRTVVTIEL